MIYRLESFSQVTSFGIARNKSFTRLLIRFRRVEPPWAETPCSRYATLAYILVRYPFPWHTSQSCALPSCTGMHSTLIESTQLHSWPNEWPRKITLIHVSRKGGSVAPWPSDPQATRNPSALTTPIYLPLIDMISFFGPFWSVPTLKALFMPKALSFAWSGYLYFFVNLRLLGKG